eukprot:SAG25_NODE_5766_length_622_cov_2.388145_1_plen_155_part_01
MASSENLLLHEAQELGAAFNQGGGDDGSYPEDDGEPEVGPAPGPEPPVVPDNVDPCHRLDKPPVPPEAVKALRAFLEELHDRAQNGAPFALSPRGVHHYRMTEADLQSTVPVDQSVLNATADLHSADIGKGQFTGVGYTDPRRKKTPFGSAADGE